MNRIARTALAALALAGSATAFAAPAHADATSQIQGWTTSSVALYSSCDNTNGSTSTIPQHTHFTGTITPPAKQYGSDCYELTDDYGRHGFTPNAYSLVTIAQDTASIFTRWVAADPGAAKAKTGLFGSEAGDKVYTIYTGPGDSFDKAGKADPRQTLKAGTPVDVNSSSWIPVQTSDGKLGFVEEDAFKPATAPAPTATPAPAQAKGTDQAQAAGAAPAALATAAPATAAPAAQDNSLTDTVLGVIPGNKGLWVVVAAIEAALILLIAGTKQKRREAKAAAVDAPEPVKAPRSRRPGADTPEAEPELNKGGGAPTLISLD
ncbi:hypothetical protein [Sinomonas sp. RB5]